MASKRLSTCDLRDLVAVEGIPFGKALIDDNISDDWRYNDYDMPIGRPFAIWTHSDNSDPVTITSFFGALIERMEFIARDDPAYFRRLANPRGLENLRNSIRRHAARNQQGKLLRALDRTLVIASR